MDRRLFLSAAGAAALSSKSCWGLPVGGASPRLSTRYFLDHLGVNVHPQNAGGIPPEPYTNSSNVSADLTNLGVTNIRCRAPWPLGAGNDGGYYLKKLSGLLPQVKTMCLNVAPVKIGPGLPQMPSPASVVASVRSWHLAHPELNLYIEGRNEPQTSPLDGKNSAPYDPSHEGLTDAGPRFASSARYQADLYAAVRADPALAHIPVIGPSWLPAPPTPVNCDYANAHVYPQSIGTSHPFSLRMRADAQNPYGSAKPWVATEFGFDDNVLETEKPWSVDERTAAKLILCEAAQLFRLGASAAWQYSLYDDDPSASQKTPWGRIQGLYDYRRRIKPMGNAFKNLLEILQTGNPGSLSIDEEITFRDDPNAFVLPLQRTTKVWDVLIWNELIHSDRGGGPSGASDLSIEYQLPRLFRSVQVFDPIAGINIRSTIINASQVRLTLKGYPLIVRVEL